MLQNIHVLPINMSHNKRKLHQKRSKTCYERAFLQASNLIIEIESKHFIPPFCSCHRLLCNTTNTSEQYKRTRQGILLPLLPGYKIPPGACSHFSRWLGACKNVFFATSVKSQQNTANSIASLVVGGTLKLLEPVKSILS